jgi:hypothetical protein
VQNIISIGTIAVSSMTMTPADFKARRDAAEN